MSGMNAPSLYSTMLDDRESGNKRLAVLLDPDKVEQDHLDSVVETAVVAEVDYFFVGGSLVMEADTSQIVKKLKERCSIPVILFPGSPQQVCEEADAVFLLSLISGRNPELLIGQHVLAAPMLAKMDIEILSTGYMLVDGGAPTTVSYISNSMPIPRDKPQIAACTAMAGEQLGMKMLYLDSGSGARMPVSEGMIRRVSTSISSPLVIGGGIREPELAARSCRAGADIIVVGTAFEQNPELVIQMAKAVHNASVVV